MSIRVKLVITYLLLLAISFLILGVAFNGLLQRHLIRTTQRSLLEQGGNLAPLFTRVLDREALLPEAPKFAIALANRVVTGDYLLVNRKQEVVAASKRFHNSIGGKIDVRGLNRVLRGKTVRDSFSLKGKQVAVVMLPLVRNDRVIGALIMNAPLEGINLVRRELLMLLFRGLVFTGAIAVILALVFSFKLVNPLKKLRQGIARVAERNFTEEITVRTGDELEELASGFNAMAHKLREYDTAQQRILQNISHDLKTPVTTIQGYAEGIADGVFRGDEAKKGLQIITREAERLKTLVNGVVQLARLENVQEEFAFSSQDPGEIFGKVEEAFSVRAAEKGIHLTFKTAQAVNVRVDGGKFSQALSNVVDNALRFARSKIEVSAAVNANEVFFHVDDDGPGVAEAERGKVFERFYKGDKGETGLGLAITKAIVERHSGRVMVSESPLSGARFSLIIPRGDNSV